MRQSDLDDQASGLRRLVAGGRVKVIAVTSGKGGVGKTNISVNLAVAMAQRGRSTLLLDADLGLANVDVLLGLQPSANLSQVVNGELGLEEIIIDGPAGIRIVPAASGVSSMSMLGAREQGGLISAFAGLPFGVDVMVVDTAAGIDGTVMGFCQAADQVLVVVCDEPASITDAYAMVKVLSRDRGVKRFQVLCNRVRDVGHGAALFRKLVTVCDRFLDVALEHCGNVPEDASLGRAVRLQRAVVEGFPSSPSGRAFKELARRADNWSVPATTSGQPAFFLERSVAAAAPRAVGAE